MSAFKAKEIVKILQKLGFLEKRQTDSHLIMYNSKLKKTISVPMHANDIKKELLKSIIKQAESTEEEFRKLK